MSACHERSSPVGACISQWTKTETLCDVCHRNYTRAFSWQDCLGMFITLIALFVVCVCDFVLHALSVVFFFGCFVLAALVAYFVLQ